MNVEPARLYATLIDRLSDVPGVVATAAFDDSGQCLACYVGESFSDLGAGRVIPILQELAAPAEERAPFEEGVTFIERHLVRVLLRRAALSTFIALVDPEADVDLVVAHINRCVDQVARASRPVRPSAAPSILAPLTETPRSSSGFYARQNEKDAKHDKQDRHDEPASRPVDEATIKRLEELSLEALGFAAEIVFERAKASVLNLAGQVPRARWVELVGRLAGEIEDDDVRDTFVTRALALPTRPSSDALDLLSPLARWVVERRTG